MSQKIWCSVGRWGSETRKFVIKRLTKLPSQEDCEALTLMIINVKGHLDTICLLPALERYYEINGKGLKQNNLF